MKQLNVFWAAGLISLAAHAGPIADELAKSGNHQLDIVATVTQGDYTYELTNFTCARDAQLQAEGAITKHERAIARWLAKQPGESKSMTVRWRGTYNGSGCYERTANGIHAYVPGRARPFDIVAPVIPGDPDAAMLQAMQSSPQPLKPVPMPEFEPSAAMSDLLRAHLESAPPYMRENFLFEGRPAVLWQLPCTQIAKFQAGLARSDKDREYISWQAMQPGQLLTVLRVDGTTAEACYIPTSRGFRIFSKGQPPFDSSWQ
jgi:hypothetical protein